MKFAALAFAFLATTAFAETGPTEAGHIMVKKSDLKWMPGPPSLPKGLQMAVIDGDPMKDGDFTMRLKLPAKYKIPPHFHPADEHVTVLDGQMMMGLGESFDEKAAQTLKAGEYARMTAGTKHFAFTKKAALIQLHGHGPWGITYVNAADDPRGTTLK
jgi:quercetin dioxygenase-like cupin family protein